MAQYATCEFCGAHLDFGEKCDCTKKEGEPPQPEHPTGKNPISILPRKGSVVKRKISLNDRETNVSDIDKLVKELRRERNEK